MRTESFENIETLEVSTVETISVARKRLTSDGGSRFFGVADFGGGRINEMWLEDSLLV